MNHDTARPLLDRLLDCTLPAAERNALAIHLAECRTCQMHLADQARLHNLTLHHLDRVTSPPGLTDRIRAALAGGPASVGIAAEGTVGMPAEGTVGIPAEGTARPDTVAGVDGAWSRLIEYVVHPSSPGGRARTGLAMLAMLVLAVGGGWLAASWTGAPAADLGYELATQHALFAQDDQLLEVRGGAAAIQAWFGKRVPFPVTMPDVPGYKLEGGRLVAIGGQRAAQLVYEQEDTQRYVSLIHFRGTSSIHFQGSTIVPFGLNEPGRFATGRHGDLAFVAWSAAAGGAVRSALVARLPVADLAALARQLRPPP